MSLVVQPSALALITVEEVRAFLNQASLGNADTVQWAINTGSAFLEGALGRPLKTRAVVLREPAPPRAWLLDLFPVDVTHPVSVAVDGRALTVWTGEPDGEPRDYDVAVRSTDALDPRLGLRNLLERRGWGGWGAVASEVMVSYTGGYGSPAVPVPDDLKLGLFYLVHKLVRDVQKQTPGLQQVDYAGGSGGYTVIESMLPKETQTVIENYRVRRVA